MKRQARIAAGRCPTGRRGLLDDRLRRPPARDSERDEADGDHDPSGQRREHMRTG